MKNFNQFIKEGNVFSKSNKSKDECNNDLIDAAKAGSLDRVKKAIENGANIHYINDLAVRWSAVNNNLDIFVYLAENGANVNANNNEALDYICEMGYSKLLKYLAQKGIIRIEEGCILKLRKGGNLSDDLIEYLLNSDVSYIKILKNNLTEEQKEKYKHLLALENDFDLFED